MRESSKDFQRLNHILEACDVILQRKQNETLETITNDVLKFYGFVKLVEIIGEATYKLTIEYRASHPEVPWKMMEGMRHVLVHDYFKISPMKLWATIENDIPILKTLIEKLIEKETKNE